LTATPWPSLTWRLAWERTTVLAEEARGDCGHDITLISQGDAERIAASLTRRYWPPSCPGELDCFRTRWPAGPKSFVRAERDERRILVAPAGGIVRS